MKKGIFQFIRRFIGAGAKRQSDTDRINPIRLEQIRYQLEQFMEKQKPFLRPRYALGDLSKDIGMPAGKLSVFINKHLGTNFSDYLNGLRIRYCEELIRGKRTGKLKLSELARNCGFSNRNTFSSAFKKHTGKTVSDYVKGS